MELFELLFKITADSGDVEQGASSAAKSFNNMGKGFTQATNAIKQGLQDASKNIQNMAQNGQAGGKKLSQMFAALSSEIRKTREEVVSFDNTSLDSLYKQFFKQQDAIDKLEKKTFEAGKALEDYIDICKEFGDFDADLGIYEMAEAEDAKLRELAQAVIEYDEALQNATVTQQQLVASMINQSDAQDFKAYSSMVKEETKEMKSGMDAFAFVIQQTGRSVSGSSSHFVTLASSVRMLARGYKEAQVAGTAFSLSIPTIATAITAVIAIIASLIKKLNEQKKALQEAQQEAAKNYTLADKELADGQRYVAILENQASTTDELTDAKKQLAQLFPEMIRGYDEEGNAIMGTNKELAEYLEYLELIREVQVDLAAGSTKDNFSSFVENSGKALKDDFKAMQDLVVEDLPQLQNSILATIEQTFGPEVAQKMSGQINSMLTEIAQVVRAGDTDKAQTLTQALIDKVGDIGEVDAILADLEVKTEDLGDRTLAIISSAILNADADVDISETIASILKIDEGVLESEVYPEYERIASDIFAIFAEAGETDEESQGLLQSILDDLADDSVLGEMTAKFETLRTKIAEGKASVAEELEFTTLGTKIRLEFGGIMDSLDQLAKKGIDTSVIKSDLQDIMMGFTTTADGIKSSTDYLKGADRDLQSITSSFGDAVKGAEDVGKAYEKVGHLKGAVDVVRQFNEANEDGSISASLNAEAIKELADYMGIEEEAVYAMLPAIEAKIQAEELSAQSTRETTLEIAYAALNMLNSMDSTMLQAAGITDEQCASMIASIQGVIAAMEALSGASVTGPGGEIAPLKYTGPKGAGGGSKKSGGGGGGKKSGGSSGSASTKNEALERELKLIERKKNLDLLTTREEITNLERVLKQYAKTAEEKEDLELKIYNLKKQLWSETLEEQIAFDKVTLQEEIAAKEKQLKTYKAGTSARKDLEKEVYQLRKDLIRQEYDLDVYYGRLTLEQQRQRMQQMVTMYKAGTQQRIELEKELYDIQQQIRQQNIDRINTLTDAIISALSNRYEQLRKEEEQYLKDSISAWKEWGDEQIAQIQAQLDALNELQKEEDRAEEIRKREYKLASLKQSLEYEYDDYNRKKLEEEITKAQQDLQDYLTKIEREDLKESLQAELDAVKERVQEEEDRLNEQLDANNAYYDELTKQQHLQAEAQKILMQSSQDEILNLLSGYASDYNLTGQTLGEQLVDGFLSKVGDIETWFQGLADRFSSFQVQVANMANGAADAFYKSRDMEQVSGGVVNYEINMTFNNPVEDAIEVRRELERLLESMRQ